MYLNCPTPDYIENKIRLNDQNTISVFTKSPMAWDPTHEWVLFQSTDAIIQFRNK